MIETQQKQKWKKYGREMDINWVNWNICKALQVEFRWLCFEGVWSGIQATESSSLIIYRKIISITYLTFRYSQNHILVWEHRNFVTEIWSAWKPDQWTSHGNINATNCVRLTFIADLGWPCRCRKMPEAERMQGLGSSLSLRTRRNEMYMDTLVYNRRSSLLCFLL